MLKRKIYNFEKGSISMYAVATVVFFVIILSAVFATSGSIRKNQLKTLVKIKEIYAQEIEITNVEPEQKEYTFAYTGSSQTFVAPANGNYKLQVWGAQGGYRSSSTYGGKGGYSTGEVYLTKGTTLYVYVGGAGGSGNTRVSSVVAGGYNGGGYRYGYKGGGGATDIRLTGGNWNNSESLLSRFIVAGGGGSDGATNKQGMYGGGTTGGSSKQSYTANSNYCGKGGMQTYSGYSASYTITTQATTGLNSNTKSYYCGGFGFGGGGVYLSSGYGGAGGGGWYGGSGTVPDSSGDDDRGGGGGSGFVWTSDTASSVPSGYSVPTTYYLDNAETVAGNASMPTHDSSSNMTGNTGNGYARITWIGFGDDETTDGGYVTSGLVLHYDGINNTGNGHSSTTTTWKDLSGNGNDGVVTNGTWHTNSLKFSSSNQQNGVKTNKNFPINFSNQTFSIAFEFSSLSGVEPLFGARTTTSDGFMLFNYSNDISLDTKGSSTRVSIGNKLQANTKYNMTFVFSGTNVKVYRSGVLDRTVSITNANLTSFPLTIFTAGTRANALGNIYNVKVYNRSLTDQEVLQNYQADNQAYGF